MYITYSTICCHDNLSMAILALRGEMNESVYKEHFESYFSLLRMRPFLSTFHQGLWNIWPGPLSFKVSIEKSGVTNRSVFICDLVFFPCSFLICSIHLVFWFYDLWGTFGPVYLVFCIAWVGFFFFNFRRFSTIFLKIVSVPLTSVSSSSMPIICRFGIFTVSSISLMFVI